MRFAFTEDQLALREGAADVLRSLCTTDDVRAQLETGDPDAGRSGERWSALADLGAIGLLAPEGASGLGLSDVELIGVAEEAGHAALPEPLSIHAGVAIPVLAAAGRSEELARAAAGELLVTVGGVDIDPEGPVVAQFDEEITTERVPASSRAEAFLLATAAPEGVELHLVPRSEVRIDRTASLDPTRDLGTLTWTRDPSTLIAAGPAAAELIDEICSRLALYSAAELVGLSAAMLEMTATYAIDRQQFGKPIGSFQAVKHLLADVRIQLEFARPAVYRAAWAFSTDDASRHHDAALAKALASQLGVDAAATCLQVHGGIGYTWEHDLQLFLKRTWALAGVYGDAATQRARALSLGLDL